MVEKTEFTRFPEVDANAVVGCQLPTLEASTTWAQKAK